MFAYPNDKAVKGSKTAFATLHASMIKKNVMGIGELQLSISALSRLVAIIPQKEECTVENIGDDDEEEEEGDRKVYSQITPPGFIIIPLAFEDDIRALKPKHDFVPDKKMVDAAIDLIRHQNIEENIEIRQSFENPVLKSFWNYIESVALGTPLEEDLFDNDDTKMNVEDILRVAGDKIGAFISTIPEDVKEQKEILSKTKQTEFVADDTGIDWIHVYEMDTFQKLKVPQLQAYLKSYGQSKAGKKIDLIHRIKNHIEHRIEKEEDSE